MADKQARVLTECRGHMLVVTLNRWEVKNACDGPAGVQMNAAMDLLDNSDDLFVGIITGAGDDFLAGADLKAAARGELRERSPRKPLIAAVEGVAVGGGLWSCACPATSSWSQPMPAWACRRLWICASRSGRGADRSGLRLLAQCNSTKA